MCAEHRDLWDASSEHEAWRMALDVLRPWTQSARAIHFEVLTELMEEALSKGEEGLARTRRELEEAREAANKS